LKPFKLKKAGRIGQASLGVTEWHHSFICLLKPFSTVRDHEILVLNLSGYLVDANFSAFQDTWRARGILRMTQRPNRIEPRLNIH
jgi:hypothetical protein